MKIEERKGMKIITPSKGKLLKNKETGAITQKIFGPLNIDLNIYEEIYKDENTKEIYEEISRLDNSDIDIQMALVELYDVFTLLVGGMSDGKDIL